MYCIQCGNQIEPNSNFCPHCGQRVSSSQCTNSEQMQAQPAPTVPAAEKILWVFQTQRKLSMVKMVPCYIVFLQDKVVLAHLTPALRKVENARASRQAKAEGKGILRGSAHMMHFWSQYYQKYYQMPVSAILAEDPTNIVIENPVIGGVYFRGYSRTYGSGDSSDSVTQGRLELTLTNREKIKFTHSQPADKSIRELLHSLFGKRLKYKK